MSKRKAPIIIIISTIILLTVAIFAVMILRRATIAPERPDESETESGIASPEEVDWEALYEALGSERSYADVTTFVDTPYYVFETTANDFMAYSKVSKSYVHVCPDPYCAHDENCEFGVNRYLDGVAYLDGRIYIQVSDVFYNHGKIYSFDKHLSDLKVEVSEVPTSIFNGQPTAWEKMQADGNLLYFAEDIYDENGNKLYQTVVWYDPETNEHGYVNEDLPIQKYIIRDGVIYALQEYRKIVTCDVDTGEIQTLLEADVPNLLTMSAVSANYLYYSEEVYTEESVEFKNYVFDLKARRSIPHEEFWPTDVDVWGAFISQDKTFFCVDHSSDAYADDPYYDFYTDKNSVRYSQGYSVLAGRIFTKDENGAAKELVQLTTHEIPDSVWWFLGYDGRMLYVTYQTYLDYKNKENIDYEESHTYMRLAVIDTVTGEVHKPWCHAHGTEIPEK